jgi:cytosine/adenosine deaminase-related metal-dependent hydrolase
VPERRPDAGEDEGGQVPGGRLLLARWLFPVGRPPIRDGAVAIRGGAIAGMGNRADLLAAHPGVPRLDLGDAALLPGLVNCHTHLELCGPPLEAPEGCFALWLIAVIGRQRQQPAAAEAAQAEASAGRLLAGGTTAIGEVSRTGQSLAPLLRAGLRGILYREVLGLAPGEAQTRADAARCDLDRMGRAAQQSLLRIGLSPHSPYSLSEELFAACRALGREAAAPSCIHAAESPEEAALLARGEGPIPGLLYPAVGQAPPARRRASSPVAYLEALGVLERGLLVIHAVHVDDEDRRRLAAQGVGVAHCPRSNAWLSGAVAPVPAYLAAGIPVGLGTDSLASVPTLDLWDEMRAALAVHGGRLTAARVLEMATLGGARVLGLAGAVGSLAVGKRADLIAVPAAGIVPSDPEASLIAGTRGADVLLTMVEGRIRHRRVGSEPCG